MMRRGQAALEFLVTYGWAFMVILVMIGAISYFGIINPSIFVPERCQFAPEVSCVDFQAIHLDDTFSAVYITMKQTTGKTAYLVDVQCEDVTYGAQALGYYLDEGDDIYQFTDSMPFTEPYSPDDEARRQWDPAETISVQCRFSQNIFDGLEDTAVRIPVTVIINKRQDGFNHAVHGEIVAKVKSVST